MTEETKYAPYLKAKRGEFRALNDLREDDRRLISPVMEIPSVSRYSSDGLEVALSRIIDYARFFWSKSEPIYFDPRMIVDKQPASRVDELFSTFLSALHRVGVDARLSAPIFALMDMPISMSISDKAGGTIVRVVEQDFGFGVDLDGPIASLRDRGGLGRFNLALDLGTLSPGKLATLRYAAPGMLLAFPHLDEFNGLILLAGSISDEHNPRPGSRVRVPRYEKLLWEQVRTILAPRLKTPLIVADYGTATRDVPDGDPRLMRASPRLTYTTDETYELAKLPRSEEGKFEPFRDIARSVVDSSFYKGNTFSVGDDFLFDCAYNFTTPGTPEMWIRASTNHHITLVAREAAGSPAVGVASL